MPLIADQLSWSTRGARSKREGGGGDFDLVVEGLDPNWPLRLPSGWRLCQVLHYDVKGWYWVLDHDGETVALDTVDDPRGLGRDGIPTSRLIELAETSSGHGESRLPAAKRIRKGMRDHAGLGTNRRVGSERAGRLRASAVMDVREQRWPASSPPITGGSCRRKM